MLISLPPSTKLRQGNVLKLVCHSVHIGVSLGRHPPGRHPPGETTPPSRHPPGQTPPWPGHLQADTPRQTHIPLGRHPWTVHAGIHTLCPMHAGILIPLLYSACWDTDNKQAVCILLECILAFGIYIFGLNTCKLCKIIKF